VETPESHLSIGEVLSLLTGEFPDVTISKIRFLESQGLIDPERTPSGYRKFYEADIVKLRWVLRQQRDHFLPLKVIKAKLDDGTADLRDDGSAEPNLFSTLDDAPAAESADAVQVAAGAVATSTVAAPSVSNGASRRSESDAAAWLAALQEAPKGMAQPAIPPRPLDSPVERAADLAGTRYSLTDLAAEAGVEVELVEQLVTFGLVVQSRFGGEDHYDESSLEVVRTAAGFVDRGVEPRHLRAYKLAADRESGLFEQLILPMLRQRNPQARAEAVEALGVLTELGESMRRSLIRQSLRSHLGPR